MSEAPTPVSAAAIAAAAAKGTVSVTVAFAGAVGVDAAVKAAIAKGYTPSRLPAGKVVGVWGGALVRTLDGDIRPVKVGDVVKKGEVILTAQDGIVQIEGARQAPAEIERVIADVNRPNPEAPTAAGIVSPGGDDSLQLGLRVDRVAEAVTPAGFNFGDFGGRVPEQIQDTEPLADDNGPAAIPDQVSLPEDTSFVFDPRGNDTGGPFELQTVAGQPIAVGTPVVLPQGSITLNPDGTLTFTPAPNFNGSFNVNYTASGPNGPVRSSIAITVTPVNDLPESADQNRNTPQDVPYVIGLDDFAMTDVDGDTAPTAVRIDALPTDGTLLLNGVPVVAGQIIPASAISAGQLSFVPDAGETGSPYASFTFSVQDSDGGFDPTPNTFSLEVEAPASNQTPAAVADEASTPEDTPVIIDVLANDSDRDDEPLTITEVDGQPIAVGSPVALVDELGLPVGEVRLTPDGKLEFVPAPGYNGPVDFTYTVTDGTTPVSAPVHVDVTPVNDPPVAADDRVTVPEDTPVTLDLLANDSDPDGEPLTITEINGTPVTPGVPVEITDDAGNPIGEVTVNPDGTVTFDPAPGYTGPASFDYTVADPSGATDTATVTLDVGGVNDAPTAAPDTGATDENTTLVVSAANGVLNSAAGKDIDPDGDTLAVSDIKFGTTTGSVGQPLAGAWGTLTLNADGSYSYTPNPAAQALGVGESQVDVFTYTITDPLGQTATTTLTITVTGVNDGPVAIDDSGLTPKDTPVTLDLLGNDSDPEDDPLTITEINGQPVTPGTPIEILDDAGNPIAQVIVNPDGTVTVTPEPGYEGPVDFEYTVEDPSGASDTANVHLVVDSSNAPPVAEDNTVNGLEDAPVSFDPRSNDFDPDTDPLTITAINGQPIDPDTPITLPEGTLSMNPDGSLTFTPNENFTGPVKFEYTVADGRGGTDSAFVTLNVQPVNDLPDGQDVEKTTREDTAYVVSPADFQFSDVDSGDTLAAVRIDTLPAQGQLLLNGVAVAAGQVITVADIAAGKLQFVPDADENGTPYANFTFSVQDGNGGFDATPNTFVLNVTPLDDTPGASDDRAETPEDTPILLDVLANDTDIDGDTLTISEINGQAVTPGTPVTLLDGNNNPIGTVTLTPDGKLNFIPAPNYNGPVDFTYTVTDGRTPVQANVHVDVLPVNDAPDAVDDRATVVEDTPTIIRVLSNDSDPDQDPLTITEINGQPVTPGTPVDVFGPNGDKVGTATLQPDGTILFDPVDNYNGPATFTYTLSDGEKSDTATVSLDVGGDNDPPSARPDTGTTDEDTPLVVSAADGVILGAAGRDTDLDGDSLSVAAVKFGTTAGEVGKPLAGAWGSLTLNADGSYSYQPNAAAQGLDDGESQIDVFTYTVTDPGGLTSTTTLTITVTGKNDGPVAIDDSARTPEDTPVTLDLINRKNDQGQSDSDVDGDPLSITEINGQPISVGNPVELLDKDGQKIGEVALNPDGTVTFTPVANFSGPVDFTYTLSDGTATDEGAVRIVVDDANDPPVALDNEVNGFEDQPLTFDPRSNDADPDGDPLTITEINGLPIAPGGSVTLPEGTLTMNPDGSLKFTPVENFNGELKFEYTIADGQGGTDKAFVTLNIAPVNDQPDAVDDVKAVIEDTPATGNVLGNDTDVDKDTLSVTGFTIDADGDGDQESFTPGQTATLTDALGKPIGTLTIGANGAFTFNPAKDYFGPVPVATYSITDGEGGTDSATLTLGPVTPAPDAPLGADVTRTTGEDSPYTVKAADFGFSDVDGDILAAVRIDSLPTNGTLTLNGVAVAAGQEISVADINAGKLLFVPDADETGVPYGSFTFSVKDSSGQFDAAPNTFTLNVDPVNDKPDAVNDVKAVIEDTPATGNVLSNDTDPENDTLTVTGFTVDKDGDGDQDAFTPGQTATLTDALGKPIGTLTIAADGSFTFNPAKDYFGPVPVVTYTMTDGKSSDSATLTLGPVTPAPDAPLGADTTKTTAEDTPYVVKAADFGFSDVDGDTLAAVRIDTLPTNGRLTLNGVALTAGQEVSVADINSGKLLFVPDANENGSPYGSFTFSVKDSSGQFDPAPNKFTLNVTPVDDASVLKPDTNTIPEDTLATGNVLTNDADIDSPLSVTTFKIAGISATFTAGQTATIPGVGTLVINANGTYTFDPADNWNGTVPQVTYTTNTGASSTLDITVTPVDDASLLKPDTNTIPEDTLATGNVLTNDADIDSPLSVTSFKIAGIDTPFTAGQTATIAGIGTLVINANGTYTFDPADNWNGTVPQVTYTTNTGASSTLDIIVTPVNDRPDGTNFTRSTQEDTPFALKTTDFGFKDPDAGATLQAVRIDTLPLEGKLTLNGVAVTAGQVVSASDIAAGKLVFTPDTHEHGSPYGSFNFSVQDNTGLFDASQNTYTVNVTAVPDTPNLLVTGREFLIETNFEGVNLGGGSYNLNAVASNIAVAGTPGVSWSTSNPGGLVEVGQASVYGATGTPATNKVLELERKSGDASDFFTTVAVQKGEVFNLSLNYAAREATAGFPEDHSVDSVVYVYWEGQLVAKLQEDPANPGRFQDINLQLIASQTGTAKLEFVAADSNSWGGVLDNIKLDLLENTGMQGYALDLPVLAGSLVDADGSEKLSLTLSGLLAGSTLLDGTGKTLAITAGNTTVDVTTGWDLSTLSVIPPAAFTGNLSVTFNAIATETSTGASATKSETLVFNVLPDTAGSYGTNDGDTLTGTAAADRLWGLNGNDSLSGGAGNDTVLGGSGNDTLNGDAGNDVIDGGAGVDRLVGGDGNDILIGGAGSDTLTGGAGQDIFTWAQKEGETGIPNDVVTDFNTASFNAGGDVLDLRDLLRDEHSGGGNSVGNLLNYLSFDKTSQPGSTVLHIKTTGTGAEDYTITLQNVQLSGSTDTQIIQNLLQQGKLIVDGPAGG